VLGFSVQFIHPSAWQGFIPFPVANRSRPKTVRRGRREGTLGEKRCPGQRKRDAALLYELEMESRKAGWQDPALVYEEEKHLFRFTDGHFAFSHEHADWELLRKRGPMKGP
jgi:hypothetical protein